MKQNVNISNLLADINASSRGQLNQEMDEEVSQKNLFSQTQKISNAKSSQQLLLNPDAKKSLIAAK